MMDDKLITILIFTLFVLFIAIIPLVILGIVTFFEMRRGFLITHLVPHCFNSQLLLNSVEITVDMEDHNNHFKDHNVRTNSDMFLQSFRENIRYIFHRIKMQKKMYGLLIVTTLMITISLFLLGIREDHPHFVNYFVNFNMDFSVFYTWWLFFYFYIVVSALMLFDARYYLLPDPLNYLLLWSGVIVALLGMRDITLESSVIGVIVTYLLLSTLSLSYRSVGMRDAIGRGDIKLSAALAAWFGVESIFILLLLASLLAMLYLLGRWIYYGYRERKIPFGPFLGISGIIHYSILLYR